MGVNPYTPATHDDRARMLAAIGVASVDDLFAPLPPGFRDPVIDLPPGLAELDLVYELRRLAETNDQSSDRPSFLGAGAYRRFVPAVTGVLSSRSEFATAYTPYQPEISQGTLQAAFEYQSVVCELTGLDVSNTGLYDVASATAEACLLAARATGRRAIALLEPVHPNTVDVIRTYAFGRDLEVALLSNPGEVTSEHACLLVQQPDFLGTIVDIREVAAAAHAVGALCIVAADPFALGLLQAPGAAGADIVTGEGRDLAGPVNFGGPSLGIFAAREQFLRQVPGRIVGRTKELHGALRPDGSRAAPRTGYVLTLQAREQFIRRERATSNLSTGQSLVALAFTMTLQALGPRGLRAAAELCYQKAHDAASRICAIPGYEVVERGPWFHEFLVRGPLPAWQLQRALASAGIEAGLDVSGWPETGARDALLFCVTEATRAEHVERLLTELKKIGGAA